MMPEHTALPDPLAKGFSIRFMDTCAGVDMPIFFDRFHNIL